MMKNHFTHKMLDFLLYSIYFNLEESYTFNLYWMRLEIMNNIVV